MKNLILKNIVPLLLLAPAAMAQVTGKVADSLSGQECAYNVRWPIPNSELNIMGKENFPQNTGYNP